MSETVYFCTTTTYDFKIDKIRAINKTHIIQDITGWCYMNVIVKERKSDLLGWRFEFSLKEKHRCVINNINNGPE